MLTLVSPGADDRFVVRLVWEEVTYQRAFLSGLIK